MVYIIYDSKFTRFTNKNIYYINVMSNIILPRRGNKIQIQNPNQSSSVVYMILFQIPESICSEKMVSSENKVIHAKVLQ